LFFNRSGSAISEYLDGLAGSWRDFTEEDNVQVLSTLDLLKKQGRMRSVELSVRDFAVARSKAPLEPYVVETATFLERYSQRRRWPVGDHGETSVTDSQLLMGKWNRAFLGPMRFDGIRVREPYFDLGPLLNEIDDRKGSYRKLRRLGHTNEAERAVKVLRRVRDLDGSRRAEAAVLSVHTAATFDRGDFDRLRTYAVETFAMFVDL